MNSPVADPECQYRESTHTYLLRGEPIPSVTQLLKSSGCIDSMFFTPSACEKGLLVHKVCEQLDLGTVQVERNAKGTWKTSVPSRAMGEMEAYRRFVKECRPEYESIEQGYIHKTLQYGGRPDRTCFNLLGGPAVLELKTGAAQKWHGVQLAGYQMLCPTGARYVCYLGETGRYKLVHVTEVEDYNEFLRALAAWWK